MSKEEIALELTKLVCGKHLQANNPPHSFPDVKKEITDLYNYIYENLKVSKESK